MKVVDTHLTPIPPSEQKRRVAEYQRLGLEFRAPAQVVYQGPSVFCPWPACGYRIDGIHFQLEKWADPTVRERLLESWWKVGLAGKCPKCRQWVLYTVTSKLPLTDLIAFGTAMMPEDWHEKDHIVTKHDG
jgi:hypothetical protein